MNIACPTCATSYRVDPAKIPATGVRARCQVCAAVFPISANGTVPRPSMATGAPPQRPAIPTGLRPSAAVVSPAAAPRPAAPVAPPAPKPVPPPIPAPVAPPAPAPVAPPAPTPAPRPASPLPAPTPAGRALNPFLANDPATRARRMARALVSDLVVYNTARRDAALKGGTIKEEFAEEIKKSYEEYELQIGKELASSTTYFNDALNEILAGGQKLY